MFISSLPALHKYRMCVLNVTTEREIAYRRKDGTASPRRYQLRTRHANRRAAICGLEQLRPVDQHRLVLVTSMPSHVQVHGLGCASLTPPRTPVRAAKAVWVG